MPGLITHYICCEAVLNTLSDDTAAIIKNNRRLYNIGSQGPDIFFYYLPGLIKKHTKNLGIKMHTAKFGAFMEAMAVEINNLEDKAEKEAAFSYLCGYLTHYALDCATHPYIYYKTGFLREGEAGRKLKFSVYHRNFETAIDVAMLKLVSSEKPSDKKIWQLIQTNRNEAFFVASLIGSSINKAYDVKISGKEVYNAMSYMTRITRIIQSRKGRRKKVMEFVEDMTIGGRICSSLIHAQELSDNIDYLNTQKTPWKMPWDDTEDLTFSFTEMFDKGCENAKLMVNALHLYIKDEISLPELLDITGDFSLKTGIAADTGVIFNFHDIIYENKRIPV